MDGRNFDNLPLEWVRAFEAAGRTGSFSAAARDLGLTQAAVSQRIGNLEARLGAPLFLRQPRGVVLTVEGEAWLPAVSDALTTLRQSAEELFAARRRRIAISASASVTELWIAPRLAGLPPEQRPELVFQTMVLSAAEAGSGPQPVRIRYGAGGWREPFQSPLYPEALCPVAAPGLVALGGEWSRLPTIGLTGPRAGWKEWCAMAKRPSLPAPSVRFDSFAAALAAAREGAGVLLASLPLCAREISQGRLVKLCDTVLRPRETYWILAGTETVSRRQWSMLTDLLCEFGPA
ncbi:LysR family transcriptional regulator [Defluviimonas sp. WL0002]|uniref:LysR family transcriptional regulator n=1 Tax=Albidovulum marisflavi TaxID=2984159 RepID=A0ABT2Z881_9RHOB|nr:LysR family transcriptional regulator [Defluviimonas sp. WL0002]MCV2867306.1 LysR family transcriptional regulator [Defluviimonas sp. WL0002]